MTGLGCSFRQTFVPGPCGREQMALPRGMWFLPGSRQYSMLVSYGKQNCGICSGTGTYSTYPGGRTHVAHCGGCWGSGKVNCFGCGGACWIKCNNCNSCGGFTRTKQAAITAHIAKVVCGRGSEAVGFKDAIGLRCLESVLTLFGEPNWRGR
jgi:hypothetical protein